MSFSANQPNHQHWLPSCSSPPNNPIFKGTSYRCTISKEAMWKARPCPLLIAHTYDVVGMSAAVKDVRRFEDKETGLLQPHEQRHTGTPLRRPCRFNQCWNCQQQKRCGGQHLRAVLSHAQADSGRKGDVQGAGSRTIIGHFDNVAGSGASGHDYDGWLLGTMLVLIVDDAGPNGRPSVPAGGAA